MEDFKLLRERMVRDQLKRRGINDSRILEVFETVPRHVFVEQQYTYMAYEDRPLPIGFDQTISQPYIVALMTELLNVQPQERVLEIGTGSGYQSAILSHLCAHVYSIERFQSLALKAEKVLKELGYDNISIFCSDGSLGLEKHSPFDKIVITAAAPGIPQPLIDQLKAGGRLVIPVGNRSRQILQRLIKSPDGNIETDDLIPVVFVPLRGVYGWLHNDPEF
jgi:protein-L-isoaspartate(D-aspartate) O-methyltransferase